MMSISSIVVQTNRRTRMNRKEIQKPILNSEIQSLVANTVASLSVSSSYAI